MARDSLYTSPVVLRGCTAKKSMTYMSMVQKWVQAYLPDLFLIDEKLFISTIKKNSQLRVFLGCSHRNFKTIPIQQRFRLGLKSKAGYSIPHEGLFVLGTTYHSIKNRRIFGRMKGKRRGTSFGSSGVLF